MSEGVGLTLAKSGGRAATGSLVWSRVTAALLGVTQRFALLAVVAILLVAILTCADIVGRSFFSASIYGLNEITALLVAVAVSACLPFALARGGTLSIDVLTSRFTTSAQSWLAIISALTIVCFMGLLSWRVGVTAMDMVRMNETTMLTGMPRAPFFFAMAIAFGIAAAVVLTVTLAALACQIAQSRGSSVLWLVLGVLPVIALWASLAGFIPSTPLTAILPRAALPLALVLMAALWAMILLSIPIGVGMGTVGLVGTVAMLGSGPALSVFGSEISGFVTKDGLSVLPLFLMMGAFAGVAGIGKDLYNLSNALIGHVRGGLAHASILACAGFGTLSGSSIATQMSIGKIALGEMRARNYSSELASGAIAAGGTLGQLIPPSSALILYAILAQQSVGRLFVGAVIPGLLATFLYMAVVAVWLWINPRHAERSEFQGFAAIARAFAGAWSVILLLTLVLGGIFTGLFTELEAGAVGAAGAFLIALARGRINRATFWSTMGEMTGSLAMIYSLIFGVVMLSFFFGVSGLPGAFIGFIQDVGLSPFATVLALILCYLVLGTVMDSFAMMMVTIPIFTPVVIALGYDPIWWGLMTIICMEAGMISPPFGLNMFIITSLDETIPIRTVYRGTWPFFASTVVKIALLVAFPALVTWLPGTM